MSEMSTKIEKTALQWGEHILKVIETQPFEEELALQGIKQWGEQCRAESMDVNAFNMMVQGHRQALPLAQQVIRCIRKRSNDPANPLNPSIGIEIFEKMVSAIWSEGVQIDNTNPEGRLSSFNLTVLSLACKFHLDELMESCLARGASIGPTDPYGETALMYAASGGNIKAINRLVSLGSDVNARCKRGFLSVLSFSLGSHSAEAVQLLLKMGMDLHLKDHTNETALEKAIHSNDIAVLKVIIAAGVDLDAVSEQGVTACHCAAGSDLLDPLKCLVEAGANFQVKNQKGLTPLECAQKRGYHTIVSYLSEVQKALSDRSALDEILPAKKETLNPEKEEPSPNSKKRI